MHALRSTAASFAATFVSLAILPAPSLPEMWPWPTWSAASGECSGTWTAERRS